MDYYSSESNQKYMSASQYKAFAKCPAHALAVLHEEWKDAGSVALSVGSYIDAYFEGALEAYKEKHPEILNKRTGELKADYLAAENIIKRIESDDFFMAHLSGITQKVMFGEISGVPFKIRMDFYHESQMIVDLKIMRDFEWVFDPTCRKRMPFVEYWGYDIQGAIYQEIVRQNTGEALPFFIAAATKEKEPDISVITIPQVQLDMRLGQIKKNAPLFQKLKDGETDADRCEKCDYCKHSKVLSGYIPFEQIGA